MARKKKKWEKPVTTFKELIGGVSYFSVTFRNRKIEVGHMLIMKGVPYRLSVCGDHEWFIKTREIMTMVYDGSKYISEDRTALSDKNILGVNGYNYQMLIRYSPKAMLFYEKLAEDNDVLTFLSIMKKYIGLWKRYQELEDNDLESEAYYILSLSNSKEDFFEKFALILGYDGYASYCENEAGFKSVQFYGAEDWNDQKEKWERKFLKVTFQEN